MRTRRHLAQLLTGVSLVTLSIAGITRATAAAGVTITRTGHVPYTVPADTGWINVEASLISTFTNNETIKDGFANPDGGPFQSLALHVRSNSSISKLVNGPEGHITAIEGKSAGNNFSTENATATGLSIDGKVPSVLNNGTIQAIAFAHDTSSSADATAFAQGFRFAASGHKTEINDLTNNGTIVAHAKAVAHATSSLGFARATAVGAKQSAVNSGAAGGKSALSLENLGTIKAFATARAVGGDGEPNGADAHAKATAVFQGAFNAASAAVSLTNSGLISARAKGFAKATTDHARATYVTAIAVLQKARGNGAGASAQAVVANSGMIKAVAITTAVEGTYARAAGSANAVDQDVSNAKFATARVNNTGSIAASVKATADPPLILERARARANLNAITQNVTATGAAGSIAKAILNNTGSIKATGHAFAKATYASALADVNSLDQKARNGRKTLVRTTNAGIIQTLSVAKAIGATYGFAEAEATGVELDAQGVVSKSILVNSGKIIATAKAYQTGPHGSAAAVAKGVLQEAGTSTSLPNAVTRIAVTNSGNILAKAKAVSKGAVAEAQAFGITQNVDNNANAATNSATGLCT